jgi:hypothetical protein
MGIRFNYGSNVNPNDATARFVPVQDEFRVIEGPTLRPQPQPPRYSVSPIQTILSLPVSGQSLPHQTIKEPR